MTPEPAPDPQAWETALQECVRDWHLTPGDRYPSGAGGLACPATRADGTPVVVKIIHPHHESEHEADALEAWKGNGAVRVLDRDDDRHAVLLEQCRPGTPLSAAGPEVALEVLIGLLPRLWITPPQHFNTLVDEAAWWRSYLPDRWERGRPFERRLLDAALEALDRLPGSQGEQMLVNQDLHGDNVLAADREPWLVIDPKPLAGEREFGCAAIIRSGELGHSRREVVGRLDRLSDELGLDRERAQDWTMAQTMAWDLNDRGEMADRGLDVIRWLMDA